MASVPRSDQQANYNVNSRRSELFGYLLLAGLAVELIFAVLLNKPWTEGWTSAILSDAMIVIGVWGEINFGRKARVAGDGAQAEANASVEKAALEVAALKAQVATAQMEIERQRAANLALEKAIAPRSLRQYPAAEKLKPFSAVKSIIEVVPDFEARRMAGQIKFLLDLAGWVPSEVRPIGDAPDGIRITFSREYPGAVFAPTLSRNAADALRDVIEKSGIQASSIPWPPGVPVDHIAITVGGKPRISPEQGEQMEQDLRRREEATRRMAEWKTSE